MTNSSEIDPTGVTTVLHDFNSDTYVVRFIDGTVRKYRAVQLTTEGRQLLDQHLMQGAVNEINTINRKVPDAFTQEPAETARPGTAAVPARDTRAAAVQLRPNTHSPRRNVPKDRR
jgi:DNA-binding MarR family transcriptional regulator